MTTELTRTERRSRREGTRGDPDQGLDHEEVFARAWADPSNTRIELPPVDINRVLRERYRVAEPLTFTRDMLWDVEVRKAWRPGRYIPSVVRQGSGRTWGGASDAAGADICLRASQQRLWLAPSEYGLVLEQFRLDFSAQKVSFIGTDELRGPHGATLRAGQAQPLFHVEHSVGGDEEQPLNRWRIVHLTDGTDSRLKERFKQMARDPWLPEFVEIYIRHDLGIPLSRRGASSIPESSATAQRRGN